MKLKPVLIALAAAPLLSACLIIDADEGRSIELNAPQRADLGEPLYAASFTRDGVVVRVNSNGCTKKEDFRAWTERRGGRPGLRFERVREDRCRALVPGGVDLVFGYEELGIDPRQEVTFVNPFVQGA